MLLALAAVAAGCGALDGGSSDEPVIGSEAMAFDDASVGGDQDEAGSDQPGSTGATPDQEHSSDRVEPDITDTPSARPEAETIPAPGSSDLNPALSPDPGVVYPTDTCYAAPIPGRQAEQVACDEPHNIEVYVSADLPGGADAPYRGLDAALEICGAEFRQRTGIGLNLATVFERSVLRPSEETWADGERTVTCYVVYPELTTAVLAAIDPVRSFGRVSVFGLAVGDCLTTFDQAASWFEPVPCDQPHEAEVFLADVQPETGFPGDAAMDARSNDLCFGPPFETFVGRDYASSSVFSIVSVPTAETWDQGDRTINCILTDDLVRSSSFQDSGL